jgi:hypothetical protein
MEGEAHFAPDQDRLLEHFVGSAEMGMRITITLLIGGSLTAGVMISQAEYRRLIGLDLAEGIRAAGHPESADEIAARSADDAELEEASRNTHGGDEGEGRHFFIHLESPQFNIGGRWEPLHIRVWRGRIASVQGFYLGIHG